MPRCARPWEPEGIFSIGVRAHSGAPIFHEDDEREFARDCIARVFAEEQVVCFGASVLINHFHVLARFPRRPGHAMQRVNTLVARRVRRRGGSGAVFQGRFFSGLCRDEASLLMRMAYVIGNPLRHGVVRTVDELRTHRWSTLGETIGLREPRLVDVPAALALLAPDPDCARTQLLELLEARAKVWTQSASDSVDVGDEELSEARESGSRTLVLPRRLHDDARAPQSLCAIAGPLPDPADAWESVGVRRAELAREQWTPDPLAAAVCRRLGADLEELRAGRRTSVVSAARAVTAHVACDYAGWPVVEVAHAVGSSGPAVAKARTRGARLLRAAGLSAALLLQVSRVGTEQTC